MSLSIFLALAAVGTVLAGALWWSRRTVSMQRKRIRELLDARILLASEIDRLKRTVEAMDARDREVERNEAEIQGADDSDLVGRANALFPGLRDGRDDDAG